MKNEISSDFLQVLLALEEKTIRDIKVASLGIIESVDVDKGTANVKLFPLLNDESNYKIITAYALNELTSDTFNQGDIVLCLFLDRNFIYNLMRYKANQRFDDLIPIDENNFHDEKYAIMIKTY